MVLRLTPETLTAAYEYLRTTPPFKAWKLPPADDVEFRVEHHKKYSGWWLRRTAKEDKSHIIAIAANRVTDMHEFLNVMAHEMIHLHQSEHKTETAAEHNPQFAKIMARVCQVHGFDDLLF